MIKRKPSYLLGLIGSGIQLSRTPAMHEHEGDEQGLRILYNLIDLNELKLDATALPELLKALEWSGFAGLNITFPVKQAIMPLLDVLSPDVEALGAVNTVVLRDGKRIGYNTDWWGFSEGFRRGLPAAKKRRVVQLGAGGAGSAVAYALMKLGVEELVLRDIDDVRTQAAADRLNALFAGQGHVRVCQDLAAEMADADGLVNCTPQGMAKFPGLPLPVELLRPDLWVADIVYFPLETALLKEARRIGCQTLSGGNMAVFQAVKAFEHFTGIIPDHERMMCHFNDMSTSAEKA